MEIEAKISAMGFTLPELPVVKTRRVRATRSGNLVFLAGHGPYKDGGYPFKGPVPEAITVEEAGRATRYNALALLATLKGTIGDLDQVTRILKVVAFVNAVPGFNRASEVANGCSELLMDLYGERGRHSRSAIAVAGLGLDICCETEMVVEVADSGTGR
ncbi:RidA family protein [Micromonospora sp. WMMD998]|uniref:RidA family protein n=1 Tax=Micromonospora sp. WMMD998 TaxID=3016092 RepID=UPI00249A8DE6|nr:RidA family protein [Micromonospora sp. WMMD998]WFE38581.1 RidA family protein [Micromonospora sp. WMMD998]